MRKRVVPKLPRAMARKFCQHALLLSAVLLSAVLLVACANVEDRKERASRLWGDLTKTVSGAVVGATQTVKGVVDAGLATKDWVTDTFEDVNERIDKVEKGLDQIKQGKQLIEDGLQGAGESNEES